MEIIAAFLKLYKRPEQIISGDFCVTKGIDSTLRDLHLRHHETLNCCKTQGIEDLKYLHKPRGIEMSPSTNLSFFTHHPPNKTSRNRTWILNFRRYVKVDIERLANMLHLQSDANFLVESILILLISGCDVSHRVVVPLIGYRKPLALKRPP